MLEIVNYNEDLARLLTIETSSIYFSCVLNGTMEGRVWVDSLDSPTFALVWNEYQGGFQLMGKAVDEEKYETVKSFIEAEVFPMLKEKGSDCFECGTDHEGLTRMLLDLFPERNIDTDQQKVFHLEQIKPIVQNLLNKINQEYSIVPINEVFFNSNYSNMDYVIDEINRAWRNKESYLMNGYGYAAISNHEIVGKALTTCSYQGMDNVGVDTLEGHRGKGISTVLVHNTLLEGKKRNNKNIWDCTPDNIPSEKTALKTGFKLVRTFTIGWFFDL